MKEIKGIIIGLITILIFGSLTRAELGRDLSSFTKSRLITEFGFKRIRSYPITGRPDEVIHHFKVPGEIPLIEILTKGGLIRSESMTLNLEDKKQSLWLDGLLAESSRNEIPKGTNVNFIKVNAKKKKQAEIRLRGYKIKYIPIGQQYSLITIKTEEIAQLEFSETEEERRRFHVQNDFEYLSLSLDIFQIDIGRYPDEEEGIQSLLANSSSLRAWQGPYFTSDVIDPWGNTYKYELLLDTARRPDKYRLYSLGPDQIKNTPDDISKIKEISKKGMREGSPNPDVLKEKRLRKVILLLAWPLEIAITSIEKKDNLLEVKGTAKTLTALYDFTDKLKKYESKIERFTKKYNNRIEFVTEFCISDSK